MKTHGDFFAPRAWFWLAGLVVLVYLGTTGFLPILGRDEPRYVQIGREMLDSGDWITPRLGGFTWFEKPSLLYWMVAASFGVFGVNEWAARFGPALCGLASAVLVWWMTRKTSENWARWSAISLASSGGLLAFSHGATFDIVLTFCVTLALAAWWKANENAHKPNRFLALFWIGVGLAFLAKGLVAFILTLGTVGLYALMRRERVKLGFWWGLPLALATSAIWYVPVIGQNGGWSLGGAFIHEFFVQHHFQRFTSDKFKHHQPFWFYVLEILPLLALPWTPFLVVSLWKTRLQKLRDDSPQARLRTFALAWLVVTIGFFSLSGSKLPGYILPALPAAFLLVGEVLSDWAKTAKRKKIGLAIGAATLIFVGVLTTTGPGVARAERDSVRRLFQVAHQKKLAGLPVAFFRTTSRPAQFYAAPHLLYGADEEPLRLETVAQIEPLLAREPLLLLAKDEDLAELQKADLCLESLAHNGELWLVLIRQKTR